jgi:uncharacterized protein
VRSDIDKNGAPRTERLTLPLDGLVEYWGQSYAARGPICASITANIAGGEDIMARVEVEGEFSLPCSRCLAETGLAIRGDMRYLFTLRRGFEPSGKKGRGEGGEGDFPDGDVDVIRLDLYQSEIDLAQCVWETLILSLPEGVLCREDCRGICPICGADKNERECGCVLDGVDPRLAVLRGSME